jgi:hypothetical protein
MAVNLSIPRLAAAGSALLLFLSTLPIWPMGYYILLGYVVGISAIMMFVRAEQVGAKRWMPLWLVVAITYNPIVPVRLPWELGVPLNLLGGVLFVAGIRRFRI